MKLKQIKTEQISEEATAKSLRKRKHGKRPAYNYRVCVFVFFTAVLYSLVWRQIDYHTRYIIRPLKTLNVIFLCDSKFTLQSDNLLLEK